MKKTILICLVGLLCLPTSTLLAQVADSPGADFLHRSRPIVSPEQGDTHRGGDARPDTFHQENFLPDLETVAISNTKETNLGMLDSEILASCILCLTSSGSLVDGVISQEGQEEGNTPAGVGEDNEIPMVFYIQAAGKEGMEEVRVTFLEEVIDENSHAPSFLEIRSVFQEGTLWDGAYGSNWTRFSVPAQKAGYISILADGRRVLGNYLAFPGDSVQLFLDLQKGEKLFFGPDQARYELQYRIQDLINKDQKENGVLVHILEGENPFPNPETKESYEKGQAAFGPRVSMITVRIPEMLEDWKTNLLESSFEKDLDRLLEYYSSDIAPEVLQFIRREQLAGYYSKMVVNLQTFSRYADGDLQELALITNALDEIPLVKQALPNYGKSLPPPEKEISFRYNLLRLKAVLERQQYKELLTDWSDDGFRDYLLAIHIFQSLKKGTESPEGLRFFQKEISDSMLRGKIQPFLNSVNPGSQISDFEFVDERGDTVSLEDLKGKAVLVNTYFTGCSASASYYRKVLSELESTYANDDRIVFVSISADRDSDKWERGNKSGLYNSSAWIRLRTTGQGYAHPFFRNYLISAAPRPLLIDREGKLVSITELYQYPGRLTELISETINHQTHE